MLRVVRGNPSDEELAALVAVVASAAGARAAGAGTAEPSQRSAWADPGYRMRTSHRPGPGAWRRSALPCS